MRFNKALTKALFYDAKLKPTNICKQLYAEVNFSLHLPE